MEAALEPFLNIFWSSLLFPSFCIHPAVPFLLALLDLEDHFQTQQHQCFVRLFPVSCWTLFVQCYDLHNFFWYKSLSAYPISPCIGRFIFRGLLLFNFPAAFEKYLFWSRNLHSLLQDLSFSLRCNFVDAFSWHMIVYHNCIGLSSPKL